jgi:hypothetical protein
MTTLSEPHVSWRRLVDRRDGRLAPSRLAQAERHLASGCGPCRATAATIDDLVGAIAEGALERPPIVAERAAIRLFRDACASFGDLADRVLGVLIVDRSDEFVAALRAAPGETRRLLWRVGAYEVDASLVARDVGADVFAQILPDGDDPDATVAGVVSARRGGGTVAVAAIEPDGRFTFRGLARGVYSFEGRVDATRFVLPPLAVG